MSEQISLDAIKLLMPKTARPFAKVERADEMSWRGYRVKRDHGLLLVTIGQLGQNGLIDLQKTLAEAAKNKLQFDYTSVFAEEASLFQFNEALVRALIPVDLRQKASVDLKPYTEGTGGCFVVTLSNRNAEELTVTKNEDGDTVVTFTEFDELEVRVKGLLSVEGFNVLAKTLHDRTLDEAKICYWTQNFIIKE